MTRPDRPVDKFGFPMPVQFGNDSGQPPNGNVLTPRPKRRLLVVGLIALFGLGLVVPWGVIQIQKMMSGGQLLRAEEQYYENNLPAALETLSSYMDKLPEEPTKVRLYLIRAQWKIEARQPEAALEDCNRAVDLNKEYAPALRVRALAYRRLNKTDEMLQDVEAAYQNGVRTGPNSAETKNFRAYMKALAGRPDDLPSAKQDAIDALDALDQRQDPSAIYDTLGYIQHLLGESEDALLVLNKAIKSARLIRQRDLSGRGLSKTDIAYMRRKADENLAVMLHHRSLVFKARNETNKADEDAAEAKRLGYDPERGVE